MHNHDGRAYARGDAILPNTYTRVHMYMLECEREAFFNVNYMRIYKRICARMPATVYLIVVALATSTKSLRHAATSQPLDQPLYQRLKCKRSYCKPKVTRVRPTRARALNLLDGFVVGTGASHPLYVRILLARLTAPALSYCTAHFFFPPSLFPPPPLAFACAFPASDVSFSTPAAMAVFSSSRSIGRLKASDMPPPPPPAAPAATPILWLLTLSLLLTPPPPPLMLLLIAPLGDRGASGVSMRGGGESSCASYEPLRPRALSSPTSPQTADEETRGETGGCGDGDERVVASAVASSATVA